MSCTTADCQGIAVAYVTCEGEGAYPYCQDCADTLTAGWEDYKGPVEIPDEMVERAAKVLLDSGIGYEAVHEGTAVLGDFDETARAMLTAALHWKDREETT